LKWAAIGQKRAFDFAIHQSPERAKLPALHFLKGRLMTSTLAVSDILGPWSGDAPTGLIQRCREAWDTPLESLNDLMVATFLNQNIATKHLLIEAKRRMKDQERDESEYFDGQLLEAIERLQSGE
jgi:hypothetical protein